MGVSDKSRRPAMPPAVATALLLMAGLLPTPRPRWAAAADALTNQVGKELRYAPPDQEAVDRAPREGKQRVGSVTSGPGRAAKGTIAQPSGRGGRDAGCRRRAGKDRGRFSNACTPPSNTHPIRVPKTMRGLRRQLGAGFLVARRGPFLVGANLEAKDFCTLVDGVVACCRQCLGRDYFKTAPKRVVTVYAFKDGESYRAGLRLYFGMEPISPYGHYSYSQRYIVINYATGPGTLVHEMTHALMAPDFPQAPIWISEGIASLYEQCRVEGESLKGDPNWRLPELKRALAGGKLPPLRKLMGMSVNGFRSRRESLHYAASRYFCKFLEERGLLRKVYRDFRDHFARDPSGVAFVEKAFGLKLEFIEQEWRTWLKYQTWK